MKITTAEYVSKGHPDKICDQISDAILDAYLEKDPDARVAVETMGGHGKIFVTGEVTSKVSVDIKNIVQNIYSEIGYTDKPEIFENISKQSPDIAAGVDMGGAGDQGIMIGYACNDNVAMLPQEIYLARKIIEELPTGFGPDAKAQVTLTEDGDVQTIVISAQCEKGASFEPLYDLAQKYNPKQVFINSCGEFTIGGFAADSGVTGRKLAVDNYGPQIPIGGGAFSGKDPSKVDRSAAYMARKIAVDYVKSGEAKEALVKIAYSIGVAEPVMATVLLDGEKTINLLGTKKYDLTPKGIIEFLDLKKPIYLKTARDGHFGTGQKWDR